MQNIDSRLRPIGYQALLQKYGIRVPFLQHVSWVGASTRSKIEINGRIEESYTEQFARDDSDVSHLIFALRYDGVELLVLKRVFQCIDRDELESAIRVRPTSKYLRRLWFLIEWFWPEQPLRLDDCPICNYVDVLDPHDYYTASSAPEHRRQRVRNNLLGNHDWCPLVRRSVKLATIENESLEKKASEAVQKIPLDMLQRAVRYLYTKETRSSFAIERQESSDRDEKYVELLIHQSREGRYTPWSKADFVKVQQNLLDPRYAATDFRSSEVRISEVSDLSGAKERVHWVGAPAKDLAALMGGICQAWKRHFEGTGLKLAISRSADQTFSNHPFLDFILAGCLSFGFVYIHPFDDGNGRTHRLLLHYVLGQTGFSPEYAIVPISAAILRDLRGYDRILESYSSPALELIEHRIDPDTSESIIANDCADLYRYIDFTAHIEQLGVWFRQASQHDIVEEIATLQAIDGAQAEMRKIVDMPDKKLRLFFSICMDNGRKPGGVGYRIGKSKRARLFPELTDMEIERLEAAIAEAFEDVTV